MDLYAWYVIFEPGTWDWMNWGPGELSISGPRYQHLWWLLFRLVCRCLRHTQAWAPWEQLGVGLYSLVMGAVAAVGEVISMFVLTDGHSSRQDFLR